MIHSKAQFVSSAFPRATSAQAEGGGLFYFYEAEGMAPSIKIQERCTRGALILARLAKKAAANRLWQRCAHATPPDTRKGTRGAGELGRAYNRLALIGFADA